MINRVKRVIKAYNEGGLTNVLNMVRGAYVNKFVILSPLKKRMLLKEYALKYNTLIFVETGTFVGDTIDYLKEKFDKLYSVELSEELSRNAQKRFKNNSHISIIHGDSGEVLWDLIPKLNSPALFWLDGHYSSIYHYNGNPYLTAKGHQDTPVVLELNAIATSEYKHIILIDDARLFKGENGYPTIPELVAIINRSFNGYEIKIKADIIRITPKKN